MSYTLKIGDVGSLVEVDLFPQQELSISLEYNDLQQPDNIKIPYSFRGSIPLSITNQSAVSYNSSGYNSTTWEEKQYEVYNSAGDLVSAGVCKVTSVTLNSAEPVINLEFSDRVAEFINTIKDLSIGDVYNDTFATTVNSIPND